MGGGGGEAFFIRTLYFLAYITIPLIHSAMHECMTEMISHYLVSVSLKCNATTVLHVLQY